MPKVQPGCRSHTIDSHSLPPLPIMSNNTVIIPTDVVVPDPEVIRM